MASEYNADNLTVLEGLEAVRKRPGMYIGSTDSRGLQHLQWEIIDNSVDEALAGHCKRIEVTLHEDGSVEVVDDGRGIPTDVNRKTGLTGLEVVLTKLHAGGKFGGSGYAVSGGLHGVGASVVNALSCRLEAWVNRGGKTHLMQFERGTPGVFNAKGVFVPGSKLQVAGRVAKDLTGTRVRYWPDMDIFEPESKIDVELTRARARQTAFLVPGLEIVVVDGRDPENVAKDVFCFEGGSKDFAAFLAPDSPLTEVISCTGSDTFKERVPVVLEDGSSGGVQDVERTVDVDVALLWGAGYETTLRSFVNIVSTPKGGTHQRGFEAAMLSVINDQLRKQKVVRQSDEASTKDDILEGVTAVVTVRLSEPQFEGQTKEILGTSAVTKIVQRVVSEGLSGYFSAKASKGDAGRVLAKVAAATKTRLAAREVKEAKRKKNALETSSMPPKLADCREAGTASAELFIVEGDSALGTFKDARDSYTQAALPIRGKILNTLKATEGKMLKNEECAAIIQVLGAGSGRTFDVKQLRYGKLCLLTDADVDGAHIRCLLLTLVYMYMRPLLEEGLVYATVPPLHRVELLGVRGDDRYIYTYHDDELAALLVELEAKGQKVKDTQRYKGLGEMDADQLWETTLDPAKRRLRRIEMGEAELAKDAFEVCMGEQVPPRAALLTAAAATMDRALIDA